MTGLLVVSAGLMYLAVLDWRARERWIAASKLGMAILLCALAAAFER